MPTLRAHFDAFNTLDLRTIAIRLGVNRANFTRKDDRAHAIDRFWRESPARSTVLAALSTDAKAALAKLAHYPAIPRRLFLGQYGRLRSTTRNSTANATKTPIKSPTDELYFAGLLHAANTNSPRLSTAFVLPPDLRAVVMVLLPPPTDHRALAPIDPPSPPQPLTLVHDVAQTLTCLHCFATLEDAPIGRTHIKLTASRLRTLNAHLWAPETPTRSVSNTRRLRWLLFWAKAASLLDSANRPTPAAWTWLDLPLAEQVCTLWDGWRAAPPTLRARYALPDADLPDPWASLLWTALAELPDAFTLTDLTAALLADRKWDRYWEAHFDTLADLEAVAAATMAQGAVEFALVTATPSGFALTPYARWLLGGDADPPQTHPPALPVWCAVDDAYTLTIDATLCSSALLQVAPFADLDAPPLNAAAYSAARCHRFTAHTVARAARCGLSLTTLFDGLQRLGIAVTGNAMQQITAWGQPVPPVTVGTYTVLRAPDRATLSAIAQHPDTQRFVAEILSPTTAIVHGTAEEVHNALHHAGFALEHTLQVTEAHHALPNTRGIPAADAAALWLAGQAYMLLGRHTSLPLTPPYADLEHLLATLPEAQRAALHALRNQMAEAVTNVLDGQVYAPTYAPTDPAQWLSILDSAMTQRALLDMVYVSPARNLPTLHRVEPYWLEEKRGLQYVRAYCHLADAVLLFRLDRIQSLHHTTLDDGD